MTDPVQTGAAAQGPADDAPDDATNDAPDQRRDRLDRLKARRQTLAAQSTSEPSMEMSFGTEGIKPSAVSVPAGSARTAAPAGGVGLDLSAIFQSGGEAGKAARAKISHMAYEMVTQTPPDEHGLIPDTPFTSAGIRKLVAYLTERAEDPASPASKMAKAVLAYLAPVEGGPTTAQGLALDKVQMLSRRIADLRGAAGQSPAVPMAPVAPRQSPPPAAARPKPQQPFGGRLAAAPPKSAAAINAKAQSLQRQMMMKVRHVLLKTPADEHGWVPGTIFTRTGVGRLMQMLHDRAAAPNSNSGAAAAKLLEALAPRPGEWDIYEGASAEKLLSLAQRLQALSTEQQT